MKGLFLIPVFLPALFGTLLVISSFLRHRRVTIMSEGKIGVPTDENVKTLHTLVAIVSAISVILILWVTWSGEHEVDALYFMKSLPIYFKIDALGRFYTTLVSIIWFLIGIYSLAYMPHEGEEERYFGFYFIVYSVLILLYYTGNLITMYAFYEMMTLTSVPLVIHNGSKESIMGGLKYMFYSMAGAYLGLIGIFFLYRYCNTLTFTVGGTLATSAVNHQSMLLLVVFLMIIGFGAKAGMFPLHAWLPAAHPVAPSPASAFLSGIIVKSGIFAIIRTIYYIVGPETIRGTWVQYASIILALITVFMGSMLAYNMPLLKRRLAYSSVSQLSYVLFGIFLLTPNGLTGSLLHVLYHACIKSGLFLCAGTMLVFAHKKMDVSSLRGIGKQAPALMWCWTIFSLALVGIPPFCGFISKWYLANGSLESGVGALAYIGPIILLISALLTAGYLISISVRAFLPGSDFEEDLPKIKLPKEVLIPLITLAFFSLILGLFPNPIINYITGIVSTVFTY